MIPSYFPRGYLTLTTSLALLAASSSFASACPEVKEVDAEILNCGQNRIAQSHARECLRIVREEGEAAIAQLEQATASRNHQGLREAIKNSTRHIESMKLHTDKAAHYPEAMINIRGSTRKETSLECFNESFDELQRLVTAMDDEIIRVQKARLRAARLSKHLSNKIKPPKDAASTKTERNECYMSRHAQDVA